MRGRALRLATPLLAALAALAATAATASAHGIAPVTKSNALFSTYCGVSDAAPYGALARLTGNAYAASTRASAAAGATMKEPSLGDTPEEAPASPKAGNAFSATVDVYFHVIHDGATGNVSDKAVRDEIMVMNLG